MDNKNVSLLIAGFLCIIIGTALIATVASEEQKYTTTVPVNNENLSMAVGVQEAGGNFSVFYYNWTATTDLETMAGDTTNRFIDSGCISSIRNESGTVYTEDTDWGVDCESGKIWFYNTTNTWHIMLADNQSTLNYTYKRSTYLEAAWGRTVLDLVPGFFALAILMAGLAMFYAVMKREGLLDRI